MDKSTADFYNSKVQRCEQHQGATTEQLLILIQAGNKLGLYDAVDVIKKRFNIA